MAIQGEFVTGHKVSAARASVDGQGVQRFALHPKLHRPLVVSENFLQPVGLLSATGTDPVEANGVRAREIIDLKRLIRAALQSMGHRPDLNRLKDRFFGLQILGRLLERVIPKRILSCPQFLDFSPLKDVIPLRRAPFDDIESSLSQSWYVKVSHRTVRNDHLVTAFAVLEEIKDSFLLHKPTQEVKICLTVLNTVFARFVLPAKLELTNESIQDRFENVRD